MRNSDIRAAWHYHDGTKHPNGHLMDREHHFDTMSQPKLFKSYIDASSVDLPTAALPPGLPALTAISSNVGPRDEDQVPDLEILGTLLHLSAGVTKKIRYPWGAMDFRAAACTGALYHIELYVVCGDIPGLRAGVYHFDPVETRLDRLRAGDYRGTLIEATGDEPRTSKAPAIIVFTDVFFRNACKYQATEYRHTFWDSGTILANTLAVSSAYAMPARVVAGFVDDPVNQVLGLDTRKEVAVALLPVGNSPGDKPVAHREIAPLTLAAEPISDFDRDFPAIHEIHAASSLVGPEGVRVWRESGGSIRAPGPSSPELIPLEALGNPEMPRDDIGSVILRRGSTCRFVQEPISFRQLSTILDLATQRSEADFLVREASGLSDVYLIVNAVEGLASGTYLFRRDLRSLELLTEGDFRREAGVLGLNQALPADASVDIFFLTDLGRVLERFGNRGYRAAQLDASITAGKVYLAAYAQRLGATGLTFFDDAVTEFFSPNAEGKSVMFLVAIGRRARRR